MENSTDLFFHRNTFGPSRPGAFDFTLLFEDSFFTIAPASLFVVAAFARTASLYRSPAKVISTVSRQIKTAFLSAFVALNLTLLILWAIKPAVSTKASVAAACLDFVAAGALFVLSSYEHTRSVAPSTIIALYLFFTLALDIARVRTLFLLDSASHTKNIAAISATSVVVKLGILLFEAGSKRHILLDNYRGLPRESTSGPYSRVLFWWINPLLRRGYKNFFQVDDLDGIDDSLSSAVLAAKFQQRWKTANKNRKSALLATVFSVLKWSIIASGIPRMLLIGLTFAQPFLITRTIDYVGNRGDQPGNIGWGLVGAYAIVYTGLALLTASSTYLMNRVTVRMRGGLVTLIFQKTVDLSITALDESAALTLMSADVERITHAFANFNIVWTAFIQIGIALYLLYNTLGAGFVAPGLCCLFALVAVAICLSLFPRYQGVWVGGIQSRVSSTAPMLGSMRSIKFLGISPVVGGLIQELRIRENKLARKFRWLILFQILFQNITTVVAPVATFTVYVLQANSAGKPLDAATAFSILSILQLVEPPIMALIGSLPTLVGSIGCLARIQAFLLSPSRQDHRLSLLQSSYDDVGSVGEEGIPLREIAHKSERAKDDVLVLNGCSFGWSTEMPLVHNIDMNVKQGALCMIIGPTGCGKSTLIKGLLGETPSSTGFVYLGTQFIAFADQDPWTINSTIKAGVCGESSVNESFYQEVIDSCGLRDDLKSMPKGDMTVVGSKGISLSGGQKARLALARAVFAKKKILILDDVFSGIDADTEEHIFRNLFSRGGLLRRNRMTIILVTHAVSRLSYAEWVVALNKDGAIEEQGSYDNLRNSGTYVSSLAVQFKEISAAVDQAVEERRPTVNAAEVNEEEGINLLVRQTGDWDTYKHYFAAAGWRQSMTAAVWAFTYVAMTKAPGLVVKSFTGPGATTSSNNKFMTILGVTAAIALFALVAMVWQHFLDMIPRASNGLHQSLLTTVLGAPLSFFTKTDSGTTLNRFSQDLNTIDNELPTALLTTVIQLAFFLIGGGLMAATATYALAAIPVVIFVLYAVQRFYLRTSRQLRHLELEQQAPLYTHFQETLSGLPSIRAFGWVDQFCSKNFELLDRSQRPMYLLACIQCWLAVVLDLMVAALATLLMVIIVSLRHKIDPGLVGLGLLNVMSFNTSLSELIKDWTLTETSIGAIARVRDFVNNTENEAKAIESVEPPAEWPSAGRIEIRDFAASYSESSELVLTDINLTIRPGEKIGICGRSGSGKSSLLASLFHLLEFRDGSITIDGHDLACIPRNVLRGRLNAIPQEPYWISTESVRFNLQPWSGSFAIDTELIRVLSKCQIWEAIEEKGGLGVKMEAESLSHGQRQLFCLARSLLRKSKVVVLDEVSASVDIHTDSIIQAVIREEFRDCTIISVAHRLNTIVDFDRIVVLHEGRVVECDTPQFLLSKPSRFKELYEL